MAENEVSTKRCPKCDSVKDVLDFAKDAKRRDGLKCWCKACNSADGKSRWLARDAQKKQADLERARDWRAANLDLSRAYTRAHQARNPEKTKANYQRWRKNNRETVRVWARSCSAKRKGAVGSYNLDDLRDIMRMQRGKCAYCRKGIKRRYHADHIVPIALNGTNDRRNIQLTCRKCNCSKHAKHPLEYARSIGLLL